MHDTHMAAFALLALAGLGLLTLFACGVIAGLRVLFGVARPGPLPWVLMGVTLLLCGPYLTAIGHPLPALAAGTAGCAVFALAAVAWDRRKGGQP
jgi:hypothetical protein